MLSAWRYRHTVLLSLMGAFFGTMVARLAISPVVPDVIDAFGVTTGGVGLALSGMWAVYAVSQLPGGILAARFGERRLILIALLVSGVASLLLASSPSFPWFVAFALLLGAGAGLYFPVASSLLADLFENTGQALGLHISGGDLSGLVVPVTAVTIAAAFGWRASILLGAGTLLLALVGCAILLRPTPPREGDRPIRRTASPRRLAVVLARPSVAYTVGVAAVLAFVFQAVLGFFPTFLIDHWGASQRWASVAFSVLIGLWVVSTPVLGRLSDRVGTDAVLALTVAAMIVGVSLLVARPTDHLGLVGIALLGSGMGWGGVIGSRFMAGFGDEERATSFALVQTVYVLLGSSGSVVVGTLAASGGWPTAYGLLVGLLSVTFAGIVLNRAFGLGL